MSGTVSERELELYRQFVHGQEKYEYFFMVLAGAAMAFAVKQTCDDVLNMAKLPLGIAVLFWALSFFSGYKKRSYTLSIIYSNVELLRVLLGNHKEVGENPILITEASTGIAKAMESNCKISVFWAKLQIWFFFAGMVFFVFWHVIEMGARTQIE